MKKVTNPGKRFLATFSLMSIFAIGTVDAETAIGKVKDVDIDENSIVMSAKDGDIIVYTDESTQISNNKETQNIKDILVGGEVNVDYLAVGDDNIAKTIQIVNN